MHAQTRLMGLPYAYIGVVPGGSIDRHIWQSHGVSGICRVKASIGDPLEGACTQTKDLRNRTFQSDGVRTCSGMILPTVQILWVWDEKANILTQLESPVVCRHVRYIYNIYIYM